MVNKLVLFWRNIQICNIATKPHGCGDVNSLQNGGYSLSQDMEKLYFYLNDKIPI